MIKFVLRIGAGFIFIGLASILVEFFDLIHLEKAVPILISIAIFWTIGFVMDMVWGDMVRKLWLKIRFSKWY